MPEDNPKVAHAVFKLAKGVLAMAHTEKWVPAGAGTGGEPQQQKKNTKEAEAGEYVGETDAEGRRQGYGKLALLTWRSIPLEGGFFHDKLHGPARIYSSDGVLQFEYDSNGSDEVLQFYTIRMGTMVYGAHTTATAH
jgi:hypothetical protein